MDSIIYEVPEQMADRFKRELKKESIKGSTKPANVEGKVRFTIQLAEEVDKDRVSDVYKYSKVMSGLG